MAEIKNIPPEPKLESETFFSQERSLINDLAQGLNITFREGDGWAIYPETGEATFDLKFFTEKGYSRTQAIFAAGHEIDHAKELAQALATPNGKEQYERRKEVLKNDGGKKMLDNCIKDVADNHRVLDRMPSLTAETLRLYREKLFPSTDFRDKPRHVQFAYAILRQGMLPDDALQLDPAVDKAMDGLRKVKGKKGQEKDIIGIITNPKLDLGSKYALIEKFVDPVFDALYQEDVNEQKQKGGSESSAKRSFKNEYDQHDRDFPSAMDEETTETVAEAEAGADSGKRQATAYETEHQVSMQDVIRYREEYAKIGQYLEPMRVQFRRIISERLVPMRHLSSPQDEGVILAPGLVAQAQANLDAGNAEGAVYQEFVGRPRTEQVPSAFELTCVFDRSGSMSTGGKMEEQQRAAILAMESLNEFMEQPEIRSKMIDPELYAKSEIRSFGGPAENVVLKELSSFLSEKDRIGVFNTLGKCTGGSTEDYVELGKIIEDMKAREIAQPGYLEKVASREIKKLVAVFSDGASSNETEYLKRKAELERMGVTVVNYRAITDGTNFTQHMATILGEALKDLCYTTE